MWLCAACLNFHSDTLQEYIRHVRVDLAWNPVSASTSGVCVWGGVYVCVRLCMCVHYPLPFPISIHPTPSHQDQCVQEH